MAGKKKNQIDRYQTKLRLILGKQLKSGIRKMGLIEKYQDGVPEGKLEEICETLQIGIDIEQPFAKNKIFSYRSNKKPLMVFKYVNTRLNHVERCLEKSLTENIFKNYGFEEGSKEDLIQLKQKCIKNKELCITQINNFGLTTVRTAKKALRLMESTI